MVDAVVHERVRAHKDAPSRSPADRGAHELAARGNAISNPTDVLELNPSVVEFVDADGNPYDNGVSPNVTPEDLGPFDSDEPDPIGVIHKAVLPLEQPLREGVAHRIAGARPRRVARPGRPCYSSSPRHR